MQAHGLHSFAVRFSTLKRSFYEKLDQEVGETL